MIIKLSSLSEKWRDLANVWWFIPQPHGFSSRLMELNDSLCNQTSVGKIVMDGRLLSSALLWLSPITLNDGGFKYERLRVLRKQLHKLRNLCPIIIHSWLFKKWFNPLCSVISIVVMAKSHMHVLPLWWSVTVLLCHLQINRGSAGVPDTKTRMCMEVMVCSSLSIPGCAWSTCSCDRGDGFKIGILFFFHSLHFMPGCT